jgi:hypothetical protein
VSREKPEASRSSILFHNIEYLLVWPEKSVQRTKETNALPKKSVQVATETDAPPIEEIIRLFGFLS